MSTVTTKKSTAREAMRLIIINKAVGILTR